MDAGESPDAPKPTPPAPRRAGGNDSRGNGRSRPRASLACMNCRQRKIKCNVANAASRPGPGSSCTSCLTLGILCEVSRDGDRRKAGSREQVTALQDRLHFLESLIAKRHSDGEVALPDGRQRLPSMPGGISAHGSADAISIDPAISQSPLGTNTMSPLTAQHPLPANSSPVNSASAATQNAALGMGQPLPGLRQLSQPGVGIPTDTSVFTPPSEKDGARLELDENCGQPRFYGPTSQLYIQRRSYADVSDAMGAYDEPNADLTMESAPLRDLLFHTFWRAQPNSVVVVDKPLFEAGYRPSSRSEYYSTFLVNSLLACATRMSTSEGVRALGGRFVDRAKVDIAQELENPNIATLQAFLLLSDFEATRGRDRLGYMYCGIACRLVFDLGLPESCDDLITQGRMSAAEGRFRHTLFLGSYVFDKLWSLYLGRPSAIPVYMLEAAHQRCIASGWSGPETLEPWVGLCTDMSEVTDILNSTTPLDLVARERLVDLDTRIRHRSEALPPTLMLQEDKVAELPVHAYGLYIQFNGIRIVLHRLLSKATAHDNTNTGIPSPESARLDHSRAIMHESAVRIARLVSAYQQICGIENAITVMLDNVYVAAAVLISHLLRLVPHDTSTSTHRDLHWLRSLADMLTKAQKHYPVTARMRATLSSFVENTALAGTFGGLTRPPSQAPTNGGQNHGPTDTEAFNAETPNLASGQNAEIFEDFFGEHAEQVFQDMDLNNMMSWVLSPTLENVGGI